MFKHFNLFVIITKNENNVNFQERSYHYLRQPLKIVEPFFICNEKVLEVAYEIC